MSHRFMVERPNGSFEDVGAYSVAFHGHHVEFYDEDGIIIVAYHADEVRTLVRDEE